MTSARDPRIGATVADSTPWWDERAERSPQAPNVIVVVLDDTGWSDFGCFGSEIRTPAIDRLAGEGVRFTNFHVTPLCSPTRASLLTGRNHHAVGMRFLAVSDTGFPNARGELPRDIQTVPAAMRDRGYGTYLVGKWHLAPESELRPTGPFHNWPLARGFDRFYGFLGGASDQYQPELYRDHSAVERDLDPDYHLSADLVDQAIHYLGDHIGYRPEDPFFLQLAFGATHAPFQAPREWTDRYRGRYDAGWDELREERLERQRRLGVVPEGTELTERDGGVPLWEDLREEQRALAVRGQEAFAGFLEYTDAQLSRLIEWLEATGQLENTLIAVFADNGAAGDGRELGTTNVIAPYNNLELDPGQEAAGLADIGDPDHPAHYATGWAMAGNTPFRLYKQFVDLGGTRSPLVVRWPAGGAEAGGIRTQFAHVIDLAATLLDTGLPVEEPDARELMNAMDGASLRSVLAEPDAPAPRSVQYFEMLGHRAIWRDGWRAVTTHRKGDAYGDDRWRLYNVTEDFSESVDLAEREPERLAGLIDAWWVEAAAHDVLPLDDRSLKELLVSRAPGTRPLPGRLVLRPGQSHLGFTTRLTGTNRSMHVSARLGPARPASTSGVLLASGTNYGGYILYLDDDTLCFEHRFLGEHVVVRSERLVPHGSTTVGFRLQRGEGLSAAIALCIDGAPAGAASIPTTSMQLAFFGLDVARDRSARRLSTTNAEAGGALPETTVRDLTILFDPVAEDSGDLSHHLEVNQ